MKKLAILASGTGTNAERITQYFAEKKTAEVKLIITNKEGAGVIERAERLNVPCRVVSSKEFKEGKALQVLKEYDVDFIILAGFLLMVPDDILHNYPNRIVNIHPSLLPKYGGKGMYGLRVHEAKCLVLPDDTPETLASRVHQLEYEHFPVAIENLL